MGKQIKFTFYKKPINNNKKAILPIKWAIILILYCITIMLLTMKRWH